MKRFHIKLVISMGIYCLITFCVTNWSYQRAGNRFMTVEKPLLLFKSKHLQKSGRYKSVFIGSSLIHRHINPLVFDSLSPSGTSPSYNLGQPGLLPLRSYNVVDHIIATPPDGLKYLFVEMNKLDFLHKNYSSKQVLAAMDMDGYLIAFRSIFESGLKIQMKVYLVFQYSRAFLFKYLGFGLIDFQMNMVDQDKLTDGEMLLEASSEGYLSKNRQNEIVGVGRTSWGQYIDNLKLLFFCL